MVLGLLTIMIGILSVVYELAHNLIEQNFKNNLVLSPNSTVYPDWINPPVPVYMKFYIFNVTNGEEVILGGKPTVNEIGPYTYRMLVPKFDIVFHENATVSFKNNHTLVFDPHLSMGSEDDVLTHLNMPLVTMGFMAKTTPYFVRYLGIMDKMVKLVGGQNLFESHTVKEFLFGYKDPIFNMISNVLSVVGTRFDPMFGFFYKFNNSADGLYLTTTGRKNYSNIHEIVKWNGEELLPFWSSSNANMINGTDGSFVHPNVKREDTRYVFFPHLYRSVKLEYEYDTVVKGLDAFRFHFANDLLHNVTLNPDNAGFCVPECYDSGILNVGSVMEGVPVFLSLPHLYNAANHYREYVNGLRPDKNIHDSIFDVEPISGAVLYGNRKLQINMMVEPSEDYQQLKHVRKFLLPMLWMSGAGTIDDETASLLRMVMTLVKFLHMTPYILIATGCLIIIIAAVCALRKRFRKAGKYIRGKKKISQRNRDIITETINKQ